MSTNSGMKMTVKIGPDEIKEAIKQYMKLRLGPTLKISPSLEVEFIIHNSYSDQRDGDFPGSVEAEIQIPLE